MSHAFSPLKHRSFALLWFASLVSNTGGWMHELAAGWLMTLLDSTPSMVALVQACTTLPVCLLAFPAGALADRVDRRRLLLVVQVVMLAGATLLGLLVLGGRASIPGLLAITLLIGVCTAIIMPTWQSITPRLVPREDLPSAIALHAVGMNISRAIGPAIGGFVIVAAGVAWPFLINALSYVAVIAALWWWRAGAAATQPTRSASLLAGMREGLHHARGNRALRFTLWRSVLFYAFGSAYWALLPLVAREQLRGGANLFGVLVGSIGLGAVAGALLLPRARARWGLDVIVRVGTVGTAIAMAGFALLRSPPLAILVALLAGASWIATLSSLNVAAQLAVPDWVRARGMALYTTVFYGCLALGSLLWGQVATYTGLTATLLAAGVCALVALAPARRLPLAALPAT